MRAQGFFQYARLRVGSVEDGKIPRRCSSGQPGFHGGGNIFGFLTFRVALEDHDWIPGGGLGEEPLRPALGVGRNHRIRRAQDVSGRTVVLLQLDDAGPGMVALEVEDVADIGPPPAVDGLILVAHHRDAACAAREETHQAVLHAVGVLEFVDQNVIEPLGQRGRHRAVGAAQTQGPEQETTEVHCIGGGQALLVGAVGISDDLVERARGHKVGRADSLVLRAIDDGHHLPHREGLLRDVQVVQHTRHQATLIIRVVDHEILANAHRRPVQAQKPR